MRNGQEIMDLILGAAVADDRIQEVLLFGSLANNEERTRLFLIILSVHNPAWMEWFAEEKTNLEQLIGAENIAGISHIGSTSIPGLLAKPTVDILLEINKDTDIDKPIASLMYPECICLNLPNMLN